MPARGALVATLALERKIDRIRRRIRLLLAVRWSVRFALGGTLASLLALVIFRLADAPFPGRHAALLFAGTTAAGALFGFCRRVTPFQAALATDARLGLKECLSSALALRHDGEQTPLVAALLADATRRSAAIDVRAVYPLRLPREARFLAGALLVLALALYLPTLPRFQSARERAERAAMRAEGERIVRVAKELRQTLDARHADLNRRLAHNLEQLGKGMQAARIGKKEALVRLHKLTREVTAAQRQQALAGGTRSLSRAGEALKQAARAAEAKASSPEAGQRLRQMGEALRRGDTEQAARLLQELANRAVSGKLSAQERQQMAQEARQIAQALADTSLAEAARPLQEAAKQLQQGQLAAAARQFEQAGGTCQSGGASRSASQMRQVEQALQQARRQLAEAGQEKAPESGQTLARGEGDGADGRSIGSMMGEPTAGQASPDAGRGTTNQQQSGGPMGGSAPEERQAAERPRGQAPFERLYAPERVATNRIDTQVRGKQGSGRSDLTPVRGAPKRGDAYQPYYEVYSSYRRAAEEALSKEEVPATCRKQVRDYFQSLQP
ncbi:MAG: hypothetical protein GX774_21750 [Armatimonadetes bacterium]|nr:hypothetical protein [Armatimonadota bacterium]